MAHSNNAPIVKWRGLMLACGTRRQRLFMNGQETPYFIDSANGIAANRTQGDEHGLYGAGMSEPHWLTKRRIAACFGGGKIADLKHRAEQYAMEPSNAKTGE